MRRVSWLIFSVLGAVSLLVLSGAVVRSDWLGQTISQPADLAGGTAFTYQGHLIDGDNPAHGRYDFVFALYDDLDAGSRLGSPITMTDVLVSEGQFTVQLDFEQGNEPLFDGTALWLEIQVRQATDEADLYTRLSPRQPLSPTPYAVYASRADWQGLQNLPAGFADGYDDDTTYLAGTGLVLSNTTFVLSPTFQLPQHCPVGQIAHWDGSSWTCDLDDDTLAFLQCAPGQIAEWNGTNWNCGQDDVGEGGGGGDITGVHAGDGLNGGGPSGDVTITVNFAGNGLTNNVARSDHDHDSDYYTQVELQTPGSGAAVHWDNLNSIPTDLADGDDDTLGGLSCADGQIARWNGSAWICDADLDTDTDALGALACADGQVAKWNQAAGQWQCAADIDTDTDTDTLGGLSCGNGQIARWNGSTWFCDADLDTDTDTLGALACVDGQVAKWNQAAGQWECAADIDTNTDSDTLGELSCADGQIARWNGSAWVCDADLDTDTTYNAGTGLVLNNTTLSLSTTYQLPQSCASGQVASWDGSSWSCVDPDSGAAGWSLTGNAGTMAGPNFLGTTDNQSLELRVNGLRTLLLEPQAGSPNFIAGYSGNSANAGTSGAAIGGGGRDLAVNEAGGDYSTVAGGAGNSSGGYAASVGGGEGNSAGNSYATIGGGNANQTDGNNATVGGGQSNMASAAGATVGGGQNNELSGAYGTIGGGAFNSATVSHAAIGGGYHNLIEGDYGTIAGGGPSDVGNPTTSNNRVHDDYGVVSGGGGNETGDDDGDSTSAQFASVGGGESNTAGASHATVAGGQQNSGVGSHTAIGGGWGNVVSGTYGVVDGGQGNASNGMYATIGGGRTNSTGQTAATVAGGRANSADGAYSAIGGGYNNQVEALAGTIPGGFNNHVGGNYGFAAGYQAQAEHEGSFVWSDSSDGFSSVGADQFLIDADGGVGIGPNSPAHLLAAGPPLMLSVDGRAEILGSELVARGVYTTVPGSALQEPSAIDAAGDTLYVTSAATNTLTLLDVSDPDHPTYIAHTASDMQGPVDVKVVGGLAYVASHENNRLVILDVSDPFNLKALESTNINLVRPQAVEVAGNRAYVATVDFFASDRSNNGLAVFDVSDPRQILPLGFINDELDGASDVAVSGDYAYVTSYFNDRLVTFNIADAANITVSGVISSASALDGPMAVQVRGNYAYVAAEKSNTLTVIDVSDPRNPVLVDGVATALTHPVSLFISGDYAYMVYKGEPDTAANCGLAVFDISNPAEILTVFTINMGSSLPEPEKPVAIHGSGDQIYVANERQSTLAIYSVNQLNSPAIRTGTLLVDHLEALGDARVDNNLNVAGGLNVGPKGALIEGQLSVAGAQSNYILGDLSLGAAGLTNPGEDEILQVYPTHQLDVHGAGRFRINDNHSLIMSSPPEKGAFFDFTSNDFGAYYSPTARIYFEVPDPYTGTTHTTEMEILTKSASDPDMRPRMTIGEEVYIYNTGGAPEVAYSTTISFTKSGDVLPGVDDAYTFGDGTHRWKAIYATEGLIKTSDGRLKENIVALEAGLDEIERLRPVSFSWIDNPADGQHYGLIAQEVAQVLPEIVDGGVQDGQPLGMNYAEVVPVLVNAIQEQQGQIEQQAAQIADLEARLTAMEAAADQPAEGAPVRLGPSLAWLGGILILGAIAWLGRSRYGGLA